MEFTTLLKGLELKQIKLKVAKFGGTIVSHCTHNIAAVFANPGIIHIYYYTKCIQFLRLISFYKFLNDQIL